MTDQREAMRARLAELEMSGGGRLTPAAVVADAKDPDSPLHSYFEWNIEKAAESYWLDQARTLITSIRVVHKTETTYVKAVYYTRDPTAGDRVQGYVSLPTLRTDSDLARAAIVAEFSRVADMLRRARELAKALEVEHDVEALLQSVVGLRQRFMEPPAQSQ